MSFISWIVVGLIAGVIANFITGSGNGIIMSVILGIVGAFVGGFLAQLLFNGSDVSGINIYSIVVSAIGAIVVILAARLLTPGRAKT